MLMKNVFRCLACGFLNEPPGGCSPQFHDKRCGFRQRYEKGESVFGI